jgi:hypothetical protein
VVSRVVESRDVKLEVDVILVIEGWVIESHQPEVSNRQAAVMITYQRFCPRDKGCLGKCSTLLRYFNIGGCNVIRSDMVICYICISQATSGGSNYRSKYSYGSIATDDCLVFRNILASPVHWSIVTKKLETCLARREQEARGLRCSLNATSRRSISKIEFVDLPFPEGTSRISCILLVGRCWNYGL